MRWCLLFLAFVISCSSTDLVVHHPPSESPSPPRVWPVLVDSDFTYDQAAEIAEAFSVWEHALNGVYEFRLERWTFNPDDVDALEQAGQGIAIMSVRAEDMPGENVLAYVNGIGGHRMFISMARVGSRSLRGVTLHETGHCLGLGHIPVRGSIMFASYDEGYSRACIDELSIRVLSEVDPRVVVEHTNYCRLP